MSTALRPRIISRPERAARAIGSLLMSAAMVGGSLLVPATAAAATTPAPVVIGNPLIERATPTDNDANVFGMVIGSPTPAGTLNNFKIWNQPGNAGLTFHAYVLRPITGTNKYKVAFDSGELTVPAPSDPLGEVATFPVGPVAVQVSDLIGWYGRGIPIDIGVGPDVIMYPGVLTPPTAGTVFTLDTAPFTVFAQARTYSLAATVTPLSAVVGQGFTVSPADLAFILKQIKIAEAHVASTTSLTGPCSSLLGTGPNQIASPLLSYGLRTVDGTCNNLQAGQETFGAADQTFPRLTTPVFNGAEDSTVPGIGPVGPPGLTSYAQTSGSVVDSEPRTVSNLIVDQTSTNPAAVAAAQFPVRTQGNAGVVPCATVPGSDPPVDIAPPTPVGCVPAYQTLDIPNVTTDVGLSPPFNSLFTIFGQFFDHGLDKITNGGNGAVFVPLKADDPLIAGADHIFGNGDDLPADKRFMVLTRGHLVTGADGFRNAPNTDSPFIDQSQTYTSHASHQVFLREYVNNTAGNPVATGKFLSSADGGLATWAMIKTQAASLLGLKLVDGDVGNIPMIAVDAYGKFIPGPARGLPQYVTLSGLVEGDTASPVSVPADARRIDTAFLNDIAHSAAPTPGGPDADSVAGGSLDTPSPAGSYDDELLDIHFICGDGRCNENIALSAIHQVFHTEHDRLVDDIKNTLTTDTSGITSLADWQATLGAAGWNGERLFQAARFVTEMQYQHLVFEEFARKIQPGINPFEPFAFNQTNVNPAITAEFAHAVYRFGHSMLTDSIPRINTNGSHNDIALLDGFLNPAAYTNGGSVGTLTSQEAAGSIIMGLSDQIGQELDEFVVETLRNNLLGLPLDLPTINMTRARSEGIPSLNNVRRQIFAATNDGAMTPYTDWVDFSQSIKHAESMVNFVAAYGTHPSILAETTIAGKRAAAKLIVNPGTGEIPPADAADFMFSTGAWANIGTTSITGLDDIDLWVGGLAESTNLFGGLLGSTFNYVFENQMTNLQNGDRFYYLARTPGMNLRAQLEGNSFAELVTRNTNAHTLKADPFATADCKFELGNLTFPATSVGSSGLLITGAGSVQDDPSSECDENAHLLQMSNGTVRYRAQPTVMPSGINAQAVYNGAPGDVVDRIWGGKDNDTFWGGPGNDIIEGGDGADIALGGAGNDIITDFAGDDVPKGGPGNDAIDGGPGLDIIMGGDGKDFTNGGANTNETFSGAGDDFAIAGQGLDAIFGDSGSDWEEGGDQPDLLIGDSSSLFFDDMNLPGHDILIGQGGDDDYDLEGGDDIGVAGPGVEKTAGASGYDWQIGLDDPQAQDMDLAQVFVAGGVVLAGVRDKFNEVEALSGWNLADTLRGDDVVPTAVGGGGFVGCDALDQAGLDRIAGLDALVPALTVDSAPIIAASATQHCLLTGNVWGDGNILLGGNGSDTLEGRGANDILDGDKYLNVRLSIRTNPDGTGAEIASSTLMETIPTGSGWTGALAGKTLQQAVFAGLIDPGRIVAVREILTPASPTGVDVALFSAPLSEYDITPNVDGSVTVNHARPGGGGGGLGDGIDTLWNIEQLGFCDVPGALKGTCDVRAPLITLATVAVVTPATVAFADTTSGATSASQLVTVTNTGFTPLVVGAPTLGGSNPGSFTIGTNLCATVAPAGSCTIAVRFAPTAVGAVSATLSIPHNGAGSPSTVNLTGTGLPFANTPASGTVTINNILTATEGLQLTVTQAIVDPDGIGPITFTWQALTAPATWTPVGTGTTFTPGNPEVGFPLRVVATYTDLAVVPVNESVTSAQTNPVINVNQAPVGVPTLDAVSAAAPQEGTQVTASTAGISDADGLGAFNFQWQSAGNNLVFSNLAGATASTFTPTQAEVNRRLRVVVTFTDLHGTLETVVSAQTTLVVGDLFTGTAAADTFAGTPGRDSATGLAGADNLAGAAADDTLNGGADDDLLNGGAGNDTFPVALGDGFDAITGGTGTDTITATANGTVIGLSALGTVEFITANGFTGVTIAGNGAANTLNFAAVTLTGIGSIDGAGGADAITGTNLADVLLGGAGADNVAGGGGNDTITGGADNDALNGNAGLDRFVFAAAFGADTITGFDANPAGGQDMLDISALGITAANFNANVVFTASGGGTNTVVTIGANSITVLGAAPAGAVAQRVTIADFILAP